MSANTTIERLLASYPRERFPLSPDHERVYVEEYKRNRGTEGLLYRTLRVLEGWMHRRVAARPGGSVLELGAGSLNHLRYERELESYDCVEPFRALVEAGDDAGRVRRLYEDIDEIADDAAYDRIVSIAVLEHLVELPRIVARSAALLQNGGVFQAAIPSEGGLLWGLSWRTTTGVAYRLRTGLDYSTVIRHEHVNTAKEILAVVGHFFGEVRVARFPLPLHHLSFYTYLEARDPRRDRGAELLS